MAAQLPSTDRQSTNQLFRRVVNGLNGLVDRHVQLVKQELKEELSAVKGERIAPRPLQDVSIACSSFPLHSGFADSARLVALPAPAWPALLRNRSWR